MLFAIKLMNSLNYTLTSWKIIRKGFTIIVEFLDVILYPHSPENCQDNIMSG